MIPDSVQQDPVIAALAARFPDAVKSANNNFAEKTVEIAAASLIEVCNVLKSDHKFVRLSSVTAVDWHPREPRFDVVYHLHSLETKAWLRLKCQLGESEPGKFEIESLYHVWRSADWYEREIFDLFGIVFRNHPNLKRILMPEGWNGHPLRKDYPIHGFKYSYAEQE
jgi:NADH-quinone oxidoreductase subunit C